MKKCLSLLALPTTAFAHPGHEHTGLLAHGAAHPEMTGLLIAAFVVAGAWVWRVTR